MLHLNFLVGIVTRKLAISIFFQLVFCSILHTGHSKFLFFLFDECDSPTQAVSKRKPGDCKFCKIAPRPLLSWGLNEAVH